MGKKMREDIFRMREWGGRIRIGEKIIFRLLFIWANKGMRIYYE